MENEFEGKDLPNTQLSEKACDFGYLIEMMSNKKKLILEIMDTFLLQVPKEIEDLNEAVAKSDFVTVKSIAHTMKSSVSIMGMISSIPILREIEILGVEANDIQKIEQLNNSLNIICKQAFSEVEMEKLKFSE